MKTVQILKRAVVLILTSASLAQADMVACGVSVEEKPGEYTKNLSTKFVDAQETKPTVLLEEGDVVYMTQLSEQGSRSLTIYNKVQSQLLAATVVKAGSEAVLIYERHSLACSANIKN